MMHRVIVLSVGILTLFSCDNDDPATSSFSFEGETGSTLMIGTDDEVTVLNQSTNAASFTWDFGDGRTSNERSTVLSYPVSGTYTVTLTAIGDGQTSQSSKTVIVKDRVLKSISIEAVQWDLVNSNGWPTSPTADIYLQIQEFTDLAVTQYSIYPNCPVVFTSSVIENVGHSTITPMQIPVPEKFIVDKTFVQFASVENVGKSYLISLMARDSDGNVYCLQNNFAGGGNYFGILEDDIRSNSFKIQQGPFSDFTLDCQFE
jgi:PKD repeat protein